MLLPTWQAGSKQILIGGFGKGRTCPCISRDTKVADCQTFFIFLITWILLSTAYRLTINNQEPLYSFALIMQLIGYALLSQKALEAW